MPFIRTVRGDIDPADLGACYSHEHVLCSPPPDVTDRDLEMDSELVAVQELTWFKQAGGHALVDMTPADYGRDAEGMTADIESDRHSHHRRDGTAQREVFRPHRQR